jgi:hypothetical protein
VRVVAVVGAGSATTAECDAAFAVGVALGERGCVVVTGGLGFEYDIPGVERAMTPAEAVELLLG